MNSTDFEQQVARIVNILEGDGALVQWNEHLPDPDNLQQLRQIDVTVRRANSFSILECRLHSRPQNVTWIEELYGRKTSLDADCVFGISSSGFTTGAKNKAKRLGVFLRDLRELSAEEVRTWGRRTEVRLFYVNFRHVDIFLAPTKIVHITRPDPHTLLKKKDGSPWPLGDLLRCVASQLNTRDAPEGVARMEIFPADLYIGSTRVLEMVIQVDWKWIYRDLHLPFVLIYREPIAGHEPEAHVERNLYSSTEIYHTATGVVPVIDASLAPLEPRSYLTRAIVDLGQPLPLRGVGVVGIGEPRSSVFHIRVFVYRRDSPEYAALLSDGELLDEA